MENVPRGTIAQYVDAPDLLIEKLETYEALLRQWNRKINLVSPSTIENLWTRHFVDSLQINKIVPRGTMSALDIGSGGGFPALVLAAANPSITWTLVESDQRKSVFLRRAAREMSLDVKVEAQRIESLKEVKFDLITARALAELDQLLNWSHRFAHSTTNFIFPKGKSWQSELTRAQENWQMDIENFPSQTDHEAQILRLSRVERRK